MRQLLEGISNSRSLEAISIVNTGCSPIVGHGIALILSGCTSLVKLNVTQCRLRQSVIEIAQALPSSGTLKRLYLSQNEIHYGQRRVALQLGANIAKCRNLRRVELAQNAITTEMAIALLRSLGEASHLRQLDLSRNEIGENAGRSLATFVAKAGGVRKLDISVNPILRVSLNKRVGQERLEIENQKPGAGNKKQKQKVYVPGCYLIATALGKSVSIKEIRMYGLVVDEAEWDQRIAPLAERVKVFYRSVDAEFPTFPRPPPPLPITPRAAPVPTKGAKTPPVPVKSGKPSPPPAKAGKSGKSGGKKKSGKSKKKK
jgi:hypothetical protein